MSLLFLVVLSCACVGSYGLYKEVCYGSDLIISLDETPILNFRRGWYFLPTKPGTNRHPVTDRIQVATANGTALDPRFEISSDKFIIRDVTERDSGFFSYEAKFTLFRIKVKDCSSKVTKEFGSDYYFKFPKNAYSLEFTPGKSLDNTYGSQPQVLWSRSNPHVSEAGDRGRLRNNKWMMNQITYEYVGYYTFRDENHKLISRHSIDVEEKYQYVHDKLQGEDLDIELGMDPAWLFDMTFKADADDSDKVVLMKAGKLREYTRTGRIQKMSGATLHIRVEDLQPSDSGTFELTDWKGNRALVVYVEVEDLSPPYVRYIVAAVAILTVVFCCCYVRKRCCKKTTGKNHSVPDTEAAPDVYYHDLQDNTQPSASAHPSASHGPTYSYPLFPNEPGSTSQQPLVPGPEEPHVSSSQTEAGATASEEPPAYDSLFSSDAQPRFEMKGTTFPSAPPLSSDASYSDVYTSDKLNFL